MVSPETAIDSSSSNNETAQMGEIDDATLHDLYEWIDQINTFSRPKKNITRDFSDGVMVAELIHFYLPRYVDLHNYSPANSTKQKMDNWFVLNRRVFRRMNFEVTEEVIRQIALCRPWIIEHVLLMLRTKIDKALRQQNDSGGGAGGGGGVATRGSPAPSPPATHKSNAVSKHGASSTNGAATGVSSRAKQTAASHPHHAGNAAAAAKPVTSHSLPGASGQGGGDSVSRVLMEQKEQEILTQNETIQILQAKVRRLEHLVHLKDLRIDDLQGQLGTARPTNNKNENAHYEPPQASRGRPTMAHNNTRR